MWFYRSDFPLPFSSHRRGPTPTATKALGGAGEAGGRFATGQMERGPSGSPCEGFTGPRFRAQRFRCHHQPQTAKRQSGRDQHIQQSKKPFVLDDHGHLHQHPPQPTNVPSRNLRRTMPPSAQTTPSSLRRFGSAPFSSNFLTLPRSPPDPCCSLLQRGPGQSCWGYASESDFWLELDWMPLAVLPAR